MPRILEIKRTLSGEEKRFQCQVLERGEDHMIVLFVSSDAMNVHGVALPAGTVTFGHFWLDRPYNVYHWLRPADGATLGIYCNLCDETRIDAETLSWLDLVVDILVLPRQSPVVLDEDELPADTSTALRARIGRAQATLFDALPQLLDELEAIRAALWPAVKDRLATDR